MLRPLAALVLAFALLSALAPAPAAATETAAVAADGVVVTESRYGFAATLARLKADVAAKGITFFLEVEQSRLAAEAGIELRPSVLLIFGNPGLGSHFITAAPQAGLDWPVRLLVFEDAEGRVWTAYTDFAWIARRHGITERPAEFAKAAEVIASIVSSVSRE